MTSKIEFSLIKSEVDYINRDFGFNSTSKSFVYLGLRLLLSLPEDDIIDAITDGTHDRGIDAIYIDDEKKEKLIHIFQFKYTESFEKVKNNFPATEASKISSTVHDLINDTDGLKLNCNPLLLEKIKDIDGILRQGNNVKIIIHFCSNLENNLIDGEKTIFEKRIKDLSNFIDIQYHNIDDLVLKIENRAKKLISGDLRIIDKNYFEKSDGELRGLIANVDAVEIFKLISNNPEDLLNSEIIEDVFNDNVRLFLNTKKIINKNIKLTSLDEQEGYKFFYYNNGITITCDRFSFPKGMRNPVIELVNLQIVNGSQTIHSLFEAYKENSELISNNINILVRIYETQNELSQKIAEYTNSQNPVMTRDIRSNDYIQKYIEQLLYSKGYYYERKKDLYKDKDKNYIIDAEKLGQILLSFYLDNPGQAINKKSLIFGNYYDDIFNEELTIEKILIPYLLFKKIEDKKNIYRKYLENDSSNEDTFISYSSFYLLFLMKFLFKKDNLELNYTTIDQIFDKYYIDGISIIREFVKNEKVRVGDKYSHNNFFKNNLLKEQILSSYDK